MRDSAQDLAQAVVRFFNSDWTKPRFEHFCHERGCCKGHSQRAAVEQGVALLVDFIFRPLAKILPAESRWGAFGPSLALQAAGHLCHRILPRVLRRAFGKFEQLRKDDGDDVADFRAHITKKTQQCVDFHSRQDTLQTLLVALLVTAPVDRLSSRLQHLVNRTGNILGTAGLASAGGGAGGALAACLACQRHLWGLVNGWDDSCPQAVLVNAVKHHLGHTASSHDALRAAALSVGAAIWARLEVLYGAWPWRLFTSGEQAGRTGCDLEVRRPFLAEHECCLDEPFGQWFRRLATTECDFDKPAIQTLLDRLRREGATSMPPEAFWRRSRPLRHVRGKTWPRWPNAWGTWGY